eukprot:g6599.t1
MKLLLLSLATTATLTYATAATGLAESGMDSTRTNAYNAVPANGNSYGAPKCFYDATTKRTHVHYTKGVHPSFKCHYADAAGNMVTSLATAVNCQCTIQHPEYHRGGCRQFHHVDGTVHNLSGDCTANGAPTGAPTASPTSGAVDVSTITAVSANYMKTQTGNSNWNILKRGNSAAKQTSPLTAFSRLQPKGNPTHFLAVCGDGQNSVCMSKGNDNRARWFGFSASGEIPYADVYGPAPIYGCLAGTWWQVIEGNLPANQVWRTGYPCLGWRGYGGYKPDIVGPDTSSKYDQGASKWEIIKGPVVSGVQYFKLKILSTVCQVADCGVGGDPTGRCLRTPLNGGSSGEDVASVAPCQDTDDFLWSAENWNLNA